MKIGIMQPYFFPYIAYWQLISMVDKYVVYDDVNYIKGGWINRNNILLSGKSHMITLQLEKSSSYKHINEIKVRPDNIEKRKILRTIEYAYSKAPFFLDIMPMISEIIMMDTTISQMNYEIIKRICAYMDINTEIILSSSLHKDNSLKSEEKVIDIVKRLGGDVYVNAIGGQELYDKNLFLKNGISLVFLKKGTFSYAQYCDEFVDNLSIIDVLMFNDKETIANFLKDYILV